MLRCVSRPGAWLYSGSVLFPGCIHGIGRHEGFMRGFPFITKDEAFLLPCSCGSSHKKGVCFISLA